MANWNYRKRISAGPGLWANVSKSGVSTSVGGKGFTVNFGKKGTYVTTSIPGTGIYRREKVDGAGSGLSDVGGEWMLFVVKLLFAGFFVFMGFMLRKVIYFMVVGYVLAGICVVDAVWGVVKFYRRRALAAAAASAAATVENDGVRAVVEMIYASGVVNQRAIHEQLGFDYMKITSYLLKLEERGILKYDRMAMEYSFLVASVEEAREKVR